MSSTEQPTWPAAPQTSPSHVPLGQFGASSQSGAQHVQPVPKGYWQPPNPSQYPVAGHSSNAGGKPKNAFQKVGPVGIFLLVMFGFGAVRTITNRDAFNNPLEMKTGDCIQPANLTSEAMATSHKHLVQPCVQGLLQLQSQYMTTHHDSVQRTPCPGVTYRIDKGSDAIEYCFRRL
jgi:hypothetical protein